MAEDSYKCLTFVNLPFTDYSYRPGEFMKRSEIEEYVAAANGEIDDLTDKDPDASPPVTADGIIDYFTEWGTISDDPNADLHPDHIPPPVGLPSLGQIIEQAKEMVTHLEDTNQDVPDELRSLAETDYRHVLADDAGNGGDDHA